MKKENMENTHTYIYIYIYEKQLDSSNEMVALIHQYQAVQLLNVEQLEMTKGRDWPVRHDSLSIHRASIHQSVRRIIVRSQKSRSRVTLFKTWYRF